MYKTIIRLQSNIPTTIFPDLVKSISKAFDNREGRLYNKSDNQYEFIFEGSEKYYGCLEVGAFSLRRQNDILKYISSWDWIDENPDESCSMLEVFARHAG